MKKLFFLFILLYFFNGCYFEEMCNKERHDRNYLDNLKVHMVFSTDSLQILDHYTNYQNSKFSVYHVYYNKEVNTIGSGYFITTDLENKILSIWVK